MLDAAMMTNDDLYWEQDMVKPASPKQKQQEAKEESLNNSISMVKTAMSAKKTPKSALKSSLSKAEDSKNHTSEKKTQAT